MITLRQIATLDVAAASGLIVVGDELVVIADDELTLSRYHLDGSLHARLTLFAGELPSKPRARKKAKPDLEALVCLPDGSWLALASGSKRQRQRGARVQGERVDVIDASGLYDGLELDDVNIEGACVVDDELVLLSRRTGKRGTNARIRLDVSRVMAALDCGRLDADAVLDVVEIDLGKISGTALGFGDAARWRDGVLFSASAEITDDPVEDGGIAGCVIGWLDRDANVRAMVAVEPTVKLEGIAIAADGRLLAVADADDRETLAPLFVAELGELGESLARRAT